MDDEFRELDAQNGWAQLFQQIRNESSNFDFTMKEAKKTQNKNLNRYRDVSPYDHSRVKLECGVDGDYINASLLEVPDARRSYILTQGPLPNTTGHFWQMVWERNSKAVLMLNRVIEKNTVKCHQYWPLGSRHSGLDVNEHPTVGLRVEYVSQSEASYYVLRRLKLTELKSGECRIVLHFHYTTWPDFSVPQSPSAFLDFLFVVRDSGALDENVGPPVVHCSAGIGRSGTFCLVDSCLVLIDKYRDLNCVDVKKILLEMRKYRMGLIQTSDQLRFSYLAILEGASRVLLFTKAKSNEKTIMNSKRLSSDSEKDVDEALKNGNVDDDDNDDDDDDDDDDDHEEEDDDGNDGDNDDNTEKVSSSLESNSPQVDVGNSVPAAGKHRRLHQTDEAPPLPPKRRRSSSKESDNDSKNVSSEDVTNKRVPAMVDGTAELVGCARLRCKGVVDGNGGGVSGCDNDNDSMPLLDDDEDAKECCMTMKDGAVVTNFGERLREAELRKRQRKERNEKMRDKIRTIQQKQQDSEKWRSRRYPLFKPISSAAVGFLLILGGGYLVYRYFWKGV